MNLFYSNCLIRKKCCGAFFYFGKFTTNLNLKHYTKRNIAGNVEYKMSVFICLKNCIFIQCCHAFFSLRS